MQLEAETSFFEEQRQQWLDEGHGGMWCVIQGRELLGFYPSLGAAYTAGAEAYGDDAVFLVKQVSPEDPTATVQRVSWSANDEWPI